jgi:[ribosomal protein S5]-alanine N-acetyltransferase
MTQAEGLHPLPQSEDIRQRIVETARLVLRPVHPREAEELHALFVDEEVRRYLTDGAVMSRAWVEKVIRDSESSFMKCGLGLWSAREQGAPPIIGLVGFRDFYEPPVFELLCVLLPLHWRRSFATEMARAAVGYAFTHTGLTEIRASTDEPNQASVRVLERLGMQAHGRMPGADSSLIGWDQLHFLLSRDDWKASH